MNKFVLKKNSRARIQQTREQSMFVRSGLKVCLRSVGVSRLGVSRVGVSRGVTNDQNRSVR